MNTSASTRSGRTSEILRTAASPLPTAITSIPWSFRTRPTIFWMLLLSSATKILATDRPPEIRLPPHTQVLNRIGAFRVGRVNVNRSGVCRKVNTVFWNGVPAQDAPYAKFAKKKGRGETRPYPLRCPHRYQGTTLRSPFFFLLLDSFFASFLSSGFCALLAFSALASCGAAEEESAV